MNDKKVVIQRLQFELDKNTDWIKTADQKTSIYLAFLGFLVTLLSPKIILWIATHQCPIDSWKLYIMALGLLIFIGGLFYCVFALISKLKGNRKMKGLVYFGDIRQLEYHDYSKKIHAQSQEDYIEDLIEQVYTTAVIAYDKHTQFTNSVLITMTGAIIIASMIIFY